MLTGHSESFNRVEDVEGEIEKEFWIISDWVLLFQRE